MSVRVVARIRPLLRQEIQKDVIVTAAPTPDGADNGRPKIVRIPNPKNDAELYSFQFNSVYDSTATQQDIFDNEVAPTVKHLFKGFDVTLFAYGVTGTGKTHTMRGGKSLADRGAIPRLLSGIYRRARKIEKDSAGATTVQVAMSYYEIYNDRVYDLFEPPEKRTLSGLPIRDNNGKSVVVGLTERPCSTLRDFEHLYDQANVNRSTSATKLNAHSSRSHAILCVKLTQTSASETLISHASAIDLAGSEDNRRTENNKERMVESASINKSLFVLAQCVEAISKKQSRIPYRESKMTRILSLGQNNGLTVMILNLAPVRGYHLDTLSSLNFANRTKKIEVNEVENEPIFKGPSAVRATGTAFSGGMIGRQPLRLLTTTQNIPVTDAKVRSNTNRDSNSNIKKPFTKTFSVYTDKPLSGAGAKRAIDSTASNAFRPSKLQRTGTLSEISRTAPPPGMSKLEIEALIERHLDQKFAERALSEKTVPTEPPLPAEVQRRLNALEERVAQKEREKDHEGRESESSDGLHFLLMARQHQARGEDGSALRMYELARKFFPNNEKLTRKIEVLRNKISSKINSNVGIEDMGDEGEYIFEEDEESVYEDSLGQVKPKVRRPQKSKTAPLVFRDDGPPTPRTQQLLKIINSRDANQIKMLKGVGSKRADAIVSSLFGMNESEVILDLEQLGSLKGVGWKTVENMRIGLSV